MSHMTKRCGKAIRIGNMHAHCGKAVQHDCNNCRCAAHGGVCPEHRRWSPYPNRAFAHYVETTSLQEV